MRRLHLNILRLEDGIQLGYSKSLGSKQTKNPKILEQRQCSRIEENGSKKYRLNSWIFLVSYFIWDKVEGSVLTRLHRLVEVLLLNLEN